MRLQDYIFVGIDLHKLTHTAVIIDSSGCELGNITFENVPSDFTKLERKVKKCIQKMKLSNGLETEAFYCFENAYGYGRALAVWLIDKGYIVKDVNPALSNRQAKHRAMYRKSDEDDARAIAMAGIHEFNKLPDACPLDEYWSIQQLVHRRDTIMNQRVRLVNQLHEQLHRAFPYYKEFFQDISRPTALHFFETYPSRKYLIGVSADEIREELLPVSHNKCSTKVCQNIYDILSADTSKLCEYQDSRDIVTRGIISDIQHSDKMLSEIDAELERLYKELGLTLATMPGMKIIMSMKLIAEIGDIRRFKSSEKLAQYAGIAPMPYGSAGKNKDYATKQGNRRLQATIYYLAVQQIQISPSGKPRNPYFRNYYEQKLLEGKNPKQALICISRKLVKVIYSMLKNKTSYVMSEVLESREDKVLDSCDVTKEAS